jgi:sec-independent protein translocase protein TatA
LWFAKTKAMYILFISGQEIILVLALALIFFGAKSIPEIAKMMGKGVREFRKATNEIQREFDNSTSDIQNELKDVNNSLGKDVQKIKKNIDKAKNIKL